MHALSRAVHNASSEWNYLMSKFVCRCGHVISSVHYPSSDGGWLISETDSEQSTQAFVDFTKEFLDLDNDEARRTFLQRHLGERYPSTIPAAEIISDLLTTATDGYVRSTVHCRQCGRLWMQKHPGSSDYESFIPDDTAKRHICGACSSLR